MRWPRVAEAGEPDRRVVVTVIGLMQILGWGSTFYLPALIADPIVRETRWPYEWVMGGLSVALLVAGAVSPWLGRMISAHGGRPVLAIGSVCLAAGLLLVGTAQNFVWYLVGWTVLGAGMGAGLYDAAFSTLGKIYGEQARGALAAVTLFGGFASTVCWPLSAYLVEHVGWRGTCFSYAALHLAFALPLGLLGVPRAERRDLGGGPTVEGAPPRPVANERMLFFLLAAVLTIAAAILSTMGAMLIALLQGRGLDLAAAVGLGMIIGPAQVGARFIEMMAGSRYHPIWTMMASALLVTIGNTLLFFDPWVFAAAIAFYAAGNGIGSVAKGTLPLVVFGAARYPLVMGRLALPILFAMALAPFLGAAAFARGGADATLAMLSGLAVINLLLVMMLRRLSGAARGA